MTEDEWKKKLTPEQYRILREKGTETAFSGKYAEFDEDGIYVCAGCGIRCLPPNTNLTAAVAGRALTKLCPTMSNSALTAVMGSVVPKSSAPAANPTSAIFSKTDRRQAANVSVSIRWPWTLNLRKIIDKLTQIL